VSFKPSSLQWYWQTVRFNTFVNFIDLEIYRSFEGTAYIFLCIYIPMASSIWCALDRKQIHEQLHDDLDSFSKVSQDSDVYMFDRIDPDAEISGPDLSDSCSNSDDGQVSGNVGGGDYDRDDDNEDWAPWDKNNHDFYMIPFHASSGYKPP
jgi:hypothetical protein